MADAFDRMEELKDLLDLARQEGDALAEAAALYDIGRVYLKDKIWNRAEDFLAQCEQVCRAAGFLENLAQVLIDRAGAASATQEAGRAESLLREAGAVYEGLGQPQGRARVLDLLAEAALARDDPEAALIAAGEGLALCRLHGDKVGAVYFLERVLPLLKQAGLTAETAGAYRELITLAESLGDMERMALGLVGLADLYEKAGERKGAAPCLEMAHDLYLKLGKEREAGLVRAYLSQMGGGPQELEK